MTFLGVLAAICFIFAVIVFIAIPVANFLDKQRSLVVNIDISKLDEHELGLYNIYKTKVMAEPQIVLNKIEEDIIHEWTRRQNSV